MVDGSKEMARKASRREGRYSYAVDEGDGSVVDCTGTQCKSCAAGMIADCVALCCCPCGLLSFLALALIKVPYVVGRRCLRRVQKKRKKWVETRRKCKRLGEVGILVEVGGGEVLPAVEDDGHLEKMKRIDGDMRDSLPGFDGWNEAEMFCSGFGNVSARLEAEQVCLELYQVCHLGFGRVSYTGIQ